MAKNKDGLEVGSRIEPDQLLKLKAEARIKEKAPTKKTAKPKKAPTKKA